MPVYQVPQFLDAGNKILGPLNARQFIYTLIGIGVNFGLYSLIQRLLPGISFYAAIFCLPTIALFGYLAFGSFNGRDAEIYVLKLILYILKPREMTYRRLPYIDDLNRQLKEVTHFKINKRWEEATKRKEEIEKDKYYNFNAADAETKAKRIRELGLAIDKSFTNSLTQIKKRDLVIKDKQKLLSRKDQKESNSDVLQVNDLNYSSESSYRQATSLNYFETDKNHD